MKRSSTIWLGLAVLAGATATAHAQPPTRAAAPPPLAPAHDRLHVRPIVPMGPAAREAIDRVGRFLKQATG